MSNLTERAIKDAFIRLLEERPISKITVKDITSSCGVNRNTFYYHFQDIPTLLETVVKEMVDDILSDCPKVSTVEDFANVAISFLTKNKKALSHTYYSANRGIFERSLMDICHYAVEQYAITVYGNQSALSQQDKSIIIQICQYTCFGALIDWMDKGMKDEDILNVHRLCEMLEEVQTTMQSAYKK